MLLLRVYRPLATSTPDCFLDWCEISDKLETQNYLRSNREPSWKFATEYELAKARLC
ncbi:hypothetical protein IE4872_PD00579 (plasmid) [Rhizobium gallicum]|uniref:Uncharacterized protein n=1 Tax=Rhizobium gallicum TaxID=56730 RepID=A0A1L5NTC2_9HYPH|nr:hypothetical protein IE4872_PD00579 [Rhizobium gallicum]